VKNLPSPARAERNQRRKAAFLPPMWPLVAIIVAVVVVAVLLTH
jgi:hypothetical protein